MKSTYLAAALTACALLLSGCASTVQGSAEPDPLSSSSAATRSAPSSSAPSSKASSRTPSSSAAASSSAASTPKLRAWAVSFCGAVNPITQQAKLQPAPTKAYADTVRARAAAFAALPPKLLALGDPPAGVAPGLAAKYATGLSTAVGVLNTYAAGVDAIIGKPTADASLKTLTDTATSALEAALKPADDATPPALEDLSNTLPECQ